MKIRIRDHIAFQADKMAKIALAGTPRALVDLYCLAPGQAQTPHTHGDQDKIYLVLVQDEIDLVLVAVRVGRLGLARGQTVEEIGRASCRERV